MASDELSSKLSRRLQIEEGAEEPVAVDLSGQENGSEEKPTTANADTELGKKLLRREELNEGQGEHVQPSMKVFNAYTEFKEFSRHQIKDMEKMFKLYDAGKDNFIDLMELKLMMEKLGAPQTHLGLKNMIKEVDEDLDNKLSFREVRHSRLEPVPECDKSPQSDRTCLCSSCPPQFLLIFRKSAAGELAEDSGLCALARLSEIDVSEEGVKGAKTFFEAKVNAISESNRFEAEIRQEQEVKKKQAEDQKQRRAAFKNLQSNFK
ncbi:EF-hand domain-containing protein D2 isoform X1 [Notolabrus celidotus]|uniref:EF-hand domain-containing protein D2 isoform X1 n=1 Tax=Notolabrus celidotus TaxID=1203425 RepID=UPI0014906A2A|nr:EF-hand domain-containing protein D2 isoform X1 [Notolabrus celidotus]